MEDPNDSTAYDESDYNFKIISNLAMTNPNAANPAPYEVGDPLTITWSNVGSAVNVELAYSIAGSDFSSPVVFAPTTANDGSFDWNVPDAIDYNFRVRVRSLTDDGFDISDADNRIRGKLAITSPGLSAAVGIGQDYLVTWSSTGTIPQVNIKYDINDGKGANGVAGDGDDYPYTLTGDPNPDDAITENVAASAVTNNGKFLWKAVPDMPTALARIKIIDSRTSPDNSDVIAVSNKFNIVGNFTLSAPNGNEDWRVNTPQNIVWLWGGTISKVKLFYSKNAAADPAAIPDNEWIEIDPGVTKDYSADGKGNGSGGQTRSYAWTIPNDISTTVRIKVQDYNDPTVKDYSNNFFKIRGSFTVSAPNGNSDVNLTNRWVTYETNRNITWTSNGTMSNVRLEYSNDSFVSEFHDIALS
ncbi:MAG: hypothetical protein AABZ14_08440, partial [Candidatus Margulisiibacteriota bacterium]